MRQFTLPLRLCHLPVTSNIVAPLQTEQNQFLSMSQSPTARAANLDAFDEPIEVDYYTGPNIISTLLPELLSRIFCFHALEELPQFKVGTRSSKLGWIGVTHVCRHWRQVALNDSSL